MAYIPYSPEQGFLLPPSVAEVLGSEHLCFFVHQVVERLDLREFEESYSGEGQRAYAPAMMLKLWFYAYTQGVTSSRQLERLTRENLAYRYLAGNLRPDHWTLNEFLRRHRMAVNTVFTQVVEFARAGGMGKLGVVAVDSTRVRANASRDRLDTVRRLRNQRARLRREIRNWQQKAAGESSAERGEGGLGEGGMERLQRQLASLPRRLEELERSGRKQRSPVDPDSRMMRSRDGFLLGYSGEIAVSEDHLIVAQRVTQAGNDNASLAPMVAEVERHCGAPPRVVLADAGYFAYEQLRRLRERGVEALVPDSMLSQEMRTGRRAGWPAGAIRDALHRQVRRRLRSGAGRALYDLRRGLVEPIFGVLKEQRHLRRFRRRGLPAVGVEFSLACTAYNLTRMFRSGLRCAQA
ncbi:MAG: transposase [Nitrosotalea sp.]